MAAEERHQQDHEHIAARYTDLTVGIAEDAQLDHENEQREQEEEQTEQQREGQREDHSVTSWAIGPTPTLDNSRILLTERRGSSEAEQLIRNRWATVREFYLKDDPEAADLLKLAATDTERLLVEQHRHVELFYTCRYMLVHEFRSTLPGRSSGR